MGMGKGNKHIVNRKHIVHIPPHIYPLAFARILILGFGTSFFFLLEVVVKQRKFPHFTVPFPILVMPSTRLSSDRYQFLCPWFYSTRVRTHEIETPISQNVRRALYSFDLSLGVSVTQ